MRKRWFLLPCSLVPLIAFSMLACSSGNQPQSLPHSILQSISIDPTTASGQAQFTATGKYADGSKVTPLTALWSDNNPWVQNEIVPKIALDANGGVSCNSAPAGTYAVWATAPIDSSVPISQLEPTTLQVHGTAQLTCP